MKHRDFELENNQIISVPFYMYNKDGKLFNTNTKHFEALDDDWVFCKGKFIGSVQGYSDGQLYKFRNKENGYVFSASEIREGLIRIEHHNRIVREINPPTIYISGAMTGIDKKVYEAHFQEAENKFTEQGWIVHNPSKFSVNDSGKSYNEILLEDLNKLAECDAIYMLKGYTYSKGAHAELRTAYALGLQCMWEDDDEIEALPGLSNNTQPNESCDNEKDNCIESCAIIQKSKPFIILADFVFNEQLEKDAAIRICVKDYALKCNKLLREYDNPFGNNLRLGLSIYNYFYNRWGIKWRRKEDWIKIGQCHSDEERQEYGFYLDPTFNLLKKQVIKILGAGETPFVGVYEYYQKDRNVWHYAYTIYR